MKIANVVIQKTSSGFWRVIVLSMKQVEPSSATYNTIEEAVSRIHEFMAMTEWDLASDD